MKYVGVQFAIIAAAVLTACVPTIDEQRRDMEADWKANAPAGLKDCEYFYVPEPYMKVVRCPGSTTSATYSAGKTTYHSTVTEESAEARQARLLAEKRAAALAKLSAEERAVLGVKE